MRRIPVAATVISASVLAFIAANPVAAEPFALYNIVPCRIGQEATLASQMAEYRALTGNDIVLYSLSLHPQGRPASAKADDLIASYQAFRRACAAADPGLRTGVLIQSLIGHFSSVAVEKDREPWTRGVNAKGQDSRWCPLDPSYRAYVADAVRRLAREKPCFVMTDDDVRAQGGECFCPLHVAELNRRTGLNRTSDEWRRAVDAAKPCTPDHDAFFRLQRETVLGVNRLVRGALDEVDPSIPAAVCMAGEEYRFADASARAIAGRGQAPTMRISNSLYLEHQRGEYPFQEVVTRTLAYCAMHEGFPVLLDEADTWPQNLWSKSGTTFHSHMVMAAMCGLKGAKIWYVNAGGVTRNYTEALASHRGYCSALAAALDGTRQVGVTTPTIVRPEDWHAFAYLKNNPFPRPEKTWAEFVLGHYGVPVAASTNFAADATWELAGDDAVNRLSDEQLRAMLSHRVLADGKAALALCRRGFADLIGADVSEATPAFNAEVFADTGKSAGRLMKADAPPLYKARPGARTITELRFKPYHTAKASDFVAPGTIVFDNRLGGRVCLTSYSYGAIFYNRYSEARKAWLARVLAELNGAAFPYIVENEQDFLCLARESADGRVAYVAAFNLNYDPVKELKVSLAAAPARVELLGDDGTWREVAAKWADGTVTLPCGLACQGAAVVKISK